jgi:general secretion pathway protein J
MHSIALLPAGHHRVRGSSQKGFTLIEILVALFIFSVVGMISAQLLGRTLDAYEVLEDRGDRLSQIHRAMFVVQRDMLQYQDRAVRTASGDSFPALMIGDEGSLEMTRGGWRNPLQRPRSNLQRVAYRLQGENLVRAYWPVLDRLGGEEPLTQTILEEVDDLEFFVIDEQGEEHKIWPPGPLAEDSPARVAGLILRISMSPIGIVERVWEVPNG